MELTQYFKEAGISFFVIGATARDIIMELHNEKSGRLTHDLDIAITVNDWEQWKKVEEEIISLENFTKDKNQKQRFIYKGKFQLDIVPFGEIMKQDSRIFWPPDEEFAMSVLGFSAADEAALSISIDKETDIKIATLSGIFLLKIAAWKDRNHKNNKDADDMGFILENYLNINSERAAMEHYDEVYGVEPFSTITSGATLLGKDINELLKTHQKTKASIVEILTAENNKKEDSKLINQIIETHKAFSFEEVLNSIENIINQLN
ncbi:nucleotidyl transferase AbiEii/AbiGii toxin family protein [Flagellimonas meridianipacifica]|uniref:Putative nucleotidyltransferase n=1 Tax=Flagellimonas meridianipacifica TaxID=1080225 RepID=A0A2T0MFA3_9FLAO|nr:nucleotidyl transferase AbiEii/AbiGii toxin family protein [Allomuricauda pacifica]PRX56267.1 putative nucleotidyltransferase [Allomuricauda pacifica]